jgi:hypothetical protein
MANTLTSLVRLLVSGTYTKDMDLSDPKDLLSKTYEQAFATGTASECCDLDFHDTRSLANSATEDLDLAGGLTNAFGVTLTFAKIKAIIIKNNSSTQTLSVGGAAATQFINWVGAANDVINIPPEGFFCLIAPLAGFAVTAGTGDLLKIANGAAGDVTTYDIILLGTSA